MSKNIVVVGGNGYIGSHMCKRLHQEGFSVHIIDDYSTSPDHPVHSYGTFHAFDMADSKKCLDLFQKIRPEAIFHFAARAQVGESQLDPFKYYEENVVKTISLLKSAVNARVPHFIFSSTCATFGIPTTETISEENEQNPINTYGLTKKMMEMVMRDLAEKKLINVLVFRYFNAAGSSPLGEIGENHDPETHLIPNLCLASLSKDGAAFQLYGDNYSTPDGSCIRDYIHVDDLAEAHFAGFKFLQSNSGFHDFNLGSEKGSSNFEVISAFETVTGEKLKVTIMPRRPGDPPVLVGNSQKAKKMLNFKPRYTLNDSIAHTLLWLKSKEKR